MKAYPSRTVQDQEARRWTELAAHWNLAVGLVLLAGGTAVMLLGKDHVFGTFCMSIGAGTLARWLRVRRGERPEFGKRVLVAIEVAAFLACMAAALRYIDVV